MAEVTHPNPLKESPHMLTIGVHPLPESCWIVVRKDGRPFTDDDVRNSYESHYGSQNEATGHLPTYATESMPMRSLTTAQRKKPCFQGVSLCGTLFVDESGDYGCYHFPDAQHVADAMRYLRLVEVAPGYWTCLDDTCEQCKAAVAETACSMLAGVGSHVDGQQQLPLGGEQ